MSFLCNTWNNLKANKIKIKIKYWVNNQQFFLGVMITEYQTRLIGWAGKDVMVIIYTCNSEAWVQIPPEATLYLLLKLTIKSHSVAYEKRWLFSQINKIVEMQLLERSFKSFEENTSIPFLQI